MPPEVIAIVVARGGSRRLPNKALLPFGGSTMIGHKVRTLLSCQRIDRVVVGSDSQAILAEASSAGAEVVVRDAAHCDESRCSANEMIRDMAGLVKSEDANAWAVWAHPTNPLVKPETYDAAIEKYGSVGLHHDSLCSVTAEHRHAWFAGSPLNFDPKAAVHQCAADLHPVLHQNGAIFIQSLQRFRETRYFYGKRPVLFAIDAMEAWDIDTLAEYHAALGMHLATREDFDAARVVGYLYKSRLRQEVAQCR